MLLTALQAPSATGCSLHWRRRRCAAVDWLQQLTREKAYVHASVVQADYERHLIDLKNKPDWFLKLTEKGSTPVLQVNEEDRCWHSPSCAVISTTLSRAWCRCITDSAEILSYLDEKIPRPHLGSPSDLPEE